MPLNESGPGATVSANIDGDLLRAFDDWIESGDVYRSRSAAIRGLMKKAIEKTPEYSTPLQPPTEDGLNHAYKRLCEAANSNGIIRNETATRVCTNGPQNLSKQEVEVLVLRPLRKRGYLQRQSNIYGEAAWQLRGWDQ